MANFRKEKVSDALLAFLAEEVRKFRDPRLKFVTISSVEVSRDLRHAEVYWTSLSLAQKEGEDTKYLSEKEVKEIEGALEKARGFLKKRISSQLTLRYVPELHFRYDRSLEQGARIEHLLRQIN